MLFLGGALIPVNRQFRPAPDGIPVFVVSNGWHTSLVLPLRESRTHTFWLPAFNQPGWEATFGTYRYVAFGWGSEKFFRASYGGRLPGPGAFARALVPGPTLLNVDFYRQAPRPGRRAVQLRLTPDEYRVLAGQLTQAFAPDSLGRFQRYHAAGYTAEDFFFRARGRYHALRTCNDWTTRLLRRTGVRTALKTPLAGPVLTQLRRLKEQ
ncbi:DUF2459 domain-containing protein [Hymenobacter algoricola]|uniref:DUF2459 domain-containing protein n=1 Tax=Hymenobacter algoricola TaxID=486267 RepID=UPI0031EB94B8